MIKSDAHPGINRRQILQSVAGLGAGALASSYPFAARAAAGQPALVTSIRSLSNPYHAVWKVGADAFGKAVGTPNTTLVTEANSEKGISDIRAMIAKTGGNMVLNVDPNNTPDARPIVEACFKAKVYVVTLVEQAGRPSSLGLRSLLHFSHRVRRGDQRRLYLRGALQGDG